MLVPWSVWVIGLVSIGGMLAAVELALSFLWSTALERGPE